MQQCDNLYTSTRLPPNNKGKNIPTHPVSAQSKHEKLERPGLSALLPALGAAFARVESVVAPTSLREASVPVKSQGHLVLGGSKLNCPLECRIRCQTGTTTKSLVNHRGTNRITEKL